MHVLVNNAGVGVQGSIVDATFADWDWGLDVNLGGAVNGLCTFLPRMIAQGQGGHVVNTSSLSGITPAPRSSSIYATAKAGLVAMSETIRSELADHDIGVSVLIAGPYKTNIREAGRNRQARYRGDSGFGAQEAALEAPRGHPDWADPLDAGERVVKAIREDPALRRHPRGVPGLGEQRFEDILAAYPPVDPELLRRTGRRRPPRPGVYVQDDD